MNAGPPTRADAVEAALARRRQHQRRGIVRRATVAVLALFVLVVSVPLLVVLPELGLPVLLWALSLLALEFDWAVQAYAWVTWRWQQFHAWFARQHLATRALVIA